MRYYAWGFLFFAVGLTLILVFTLRSSDGEIINEDRSKVDHGNLKMAVIIEPRKHAAMDLVVRNVYEELEDDWGIQIFHGTLNEEYVKGLFGDLDPKRLSYVNTGVTNFNDGHEYSAYVNSMEFWSAIPAEHILIFQTDSVILPRNPHVIEEFMDCDYIGAPWEFFEEFPKGRVGCGGFSYRKRSAMIKILMETPPNPKDKWEDMYYVEEIEKREDLKMASVALAKQFCVGAMYSEHPFSVHQCWNGGLPKEQYDKLVKNYPIIETLRKLNA